ncbi:hypothetical protein K493DRAFT_343918 [Basidiobolus meristosporus CBS 931.73]|uniref:Uncharacterized protein n=1 Tax=Basidiobolus meristosporus CBS 931.73 TaxID=1314790 RepID=A0A1Y1ZCQ5_9FUNG|nr:hypothetical protein K493DRAFT_343918 [Basidiobolus meristosporus CBS 931.73]|eukprot:ORY07757.1 hypothetical protein K493DRAFT_343918 [Basidiobolus meristosporus CBS 931.73]
MSVSSNVSTIARNSSPDYTASTASTNDSLFFVVAGATLAGLALFVAAYFWWKKYRLQREIQRRVKIALDRHVYNGSAVNTRDEETPPNYLKKSSQLTLPLNTVTEITEKALSRDLGGHKFATIVQHGRRAHRTDQLLLSLRCNHFYIGLSVVLKKELSGDTRDGVPNNGLAKPYER